MLLTDLKKVREIDSKIGNAHRQLAELYQKRSKLMGEQASGQPAIPLETVPLHEQMYHKVAKQWEYYGIKLPAYSTLKNKFIKAEKTLGVISQTYPYIAKDMEIIAVPPSKQMDFPVNVALRANQQLANLPDYISAEIKKPKPQKGWEILLAYSAESSLYAGSPKKILGNKSYMLAGYDTRALGPREYAALTLQMDTLLDQETWTVLLKDTPKKGVTPYVGYRHGSYRFDIEELDNVLDDDGFRPAIRV